MFDLVIRGDNVVTPQGTGAFDVCVKGTTIAAVTRPGIVSDSQAGQIIDQQCRMRPARREETFLHPAVDSNAGAFEPAAAVDGQMCGLCHLGKSHNIDPETPCMRFAPMGHGQLHVVDADDGGHTRSA